MKNPVKIDYFSDVLCIWAWITQKRIDELNKNLGDKIEIRYRYLDIFGNTQEKMDKQWSEKGHFEGFAEHIVDSAKPYPDANVASNIWSKVRPSTSASAHLVLKAIELGYGMKKSAAMALVFRKAFFIDAQDISDLGLLFARAEKNGLDIAVIDEAIKNGKAMAALMSDYQMAKELSLKGSPTYIIDNGRQTLYGNVGYKLLLVNIEEQFKHPYNQASWC